MADTLGDQIARIVDGDRKAIAWLYDTFAPVLFRRLRARYGFPGGLDAQELLHDAFVFFLQHDARVLTQFLERTDGDERTHDALARHLWDLACGVASNRRRERTRRPEVALIDADAIGDNGDPAEYSLKEDMLLRLDDCLRQRNPRVYLYFTLRYLDGLSPEQIAESTGWSRKATYKLRQALNDAVSECAEQLHLSS
ncbi:MAG: hypothetical protein AAF184_14730 [Pseudomonadota bacterium]